jgi:5-formyltetrahydrofolate cyclo-ligase
VNDEIVTGTRVRREKARLRKAVIEIRDQLSEPLRAEKSNRIRLMVRSFFEEMAPRPARVHIFLAFGSEVATKGILEDLWERGHAVVVPVVRTDPPRIVLAPMTPGTRMEEGPFGIPEPRGFDPAQPESVTVYLLPGVAFDRDGRRLGYGKGYYDTLLSHIPQSALKVGIAFSEQIVPRVPVNRRDVSMDVIITDEEILRIDRP